VIVRAVRGDAGEGKAHRYRERTSPRLIIWRTQAPMPVMLASRKYLGRQAPVRQAETQRGVGRDGPAAGAVAHGAAARVRRAVVVAEVGVAGAVGAVRHARAEAGETPYRSR
jgi:hypothetical protein